MGALGYEPPPGMKMIILGPDTDVTYADVASALGAPGPDDAMYCSIDMFRDSAQMIAGEDEALAAALVVFQRALASRSMHAFVDELGQIVPLSEFSSPLEFMSGTIAGAAAWLLDVLAAWPRDPLGLTGHDYHCMENRVVDLLNDAARRRGIVADL